MDGWNDASVKYDEALIAFVRARMLAILVCGKDIRDSFDKVDQLATQIKVRAIEGQIYDGFEKLHDLMIGANRLASMIREESEIEEAVLKNHPSIQ